MSSIGELERGTKNRGFALFQSTGQVTEQLTGQVAGEVTGAVTGEVERLVLAMQGEMKRSGIQDALGLRYEERWRTATVIHTRII